MGSLDSNKLQETDNAILIMINELSSRLGITERNLREVRWVDNPNYAPDWPTFLLGDTLGLRTELKGKLTLAEWRPLLASSLVFETRFRGRERLWRLWGFSSLGISIFPTALLFLVLSRFLPAGPVYTLIARGYSYVTILFFFAVFFLLVAVPDPYFRKLRLRADRMACEEFGTKQDLLAVLKKIDDLAISSGGRITKLISPAPSLSRRIRYLAD